MKYIIQIDKLYDSYHNIEFGYVGIDLNSGKMHYYSKYDGNGNYSLDTLTEFDIHNVTCQQLNLHLCYCGYKTSKEPIQELNNLISKVIRMHLAYNVQKGYPIETLNFNSSSLSIKHINNFSFFGDCKFSGRYIPIQNTIELPISNYGWCTYTNQEKSEVEDVLLHECGHMKVSSSKLDIEKKEVRVRTGFYNSIVKVEPVFLSNGDVFLKVIKVEDLSKIGTERILEEVMNDFDCSQINPNFVSRYPKVGNILNNLCDGRLGTARYHDDGICELYDSLTKIINSIDMVEELLKTIIDITESNEQDYEKNNNHMMKLLTKYQSSKKM